MKFASATLRSTRDLREEPRRLITRSSSGNRISSNRKRRSAEFRLSDLRRHALIVESFVKMEDRPLACDAFNRPDSREGTVSQSISSTPGQGFGVTDIRSGRRGIHNLLNSHVGNLQ